MAEITRDDNDEDMSRFEIGDRVHSKQIGSRTAFDGVVEHKVASHTLRLNSRNLFIAGYYHVSDGAGGLWHRADADLH